MLDERFKRPQWGSGPGVTRLVVTDWDDPVFDSFTPNPGTKDEFWAGPQFSGVRVARVVSLSARAAQVSVENGRIVYTSFVAFDPDAFTPEHVAYIRTSGDNLPHLINSLIQTATLIAGETALDDPNRVFGDQPPYTIEAYWIDRPDEKITLSLLRNAH